MFTVMGGSTRSGWGSTAWREFERVGEFRRMLELSCYQIVQQVTLSSNKAAGSLLEVS